MSLAVQGLVIAAPNPAAAAEPVEAFDVGAADVELYAGFDGIGRRADRRTSDPLTD